MKRILSYSPLIVFILYAFLPACSLIGALSGYAFTLYSEPVYTIGLSVITLAAMVLFLCIKPKLNKANAVFCALLAPFSAINGLCLVLADNHWTLLSTMITFLCCGCSIVLAVRFVYPPVLKFLSLILSVLLLLCLLFAFAVKLLFGSFGYQAVVQSVPSPQGTFVAEVIDSDEGALGGDTLVQVRNNRKRVNLLVGQFSKAPVCVYTGEWGEFETMEIDWEDEQTLLINGETYWIE